METPTEINLTPEDRAGIVFYVRRAIQAEKEKRFVFERINNLADIDELHLQEIVEDLEGDMRRTNRKIPDQEILDRLGKLHH